MSQENNDTQNAVQELQQFAQAPQQINTSTTTREVVKTKYDMEMIHVNNFLENSKDKVKIKQALDTYSEYSNQKIMEYANLGLSVANGDYYIIPYNNKPKFEVDYKGLLKIASSEARKNGFQLIVKADTIRKDFIRCDVNTEGLIDNIVLENGKINAEVVTAYCILSLMDIKTRQIIMQKVEVLPIKEYQNAKNASKGGSVHKNYQTEMAKKIALRRATKILNTMFASDILDKLFNLDNESYDMDVDVKKTEALPKKVNHIGLKK